MNRRVRESYICHIVDSDEIIYHPTQSVGVDFITTQTDERFGKLFKVTINVISKQCMRVTSLFKERLHVLGRERHRINSTSHITTRLRAYQCNNRRFSCVLHSFSYRLDLPAL